MVWDIRTTDTFYGPEQNLQAFFVVDVGKSRYSVFKFWSYHQFSNVRTVWEPTVFVYIFLRASKKFDLGQVMSGGMNISK